MAARSWKGLNYWDISKDPSISEPGLEGLDDLIRQCSTVVAGIDVSDSLALVVLGENKNIWFVWGHVWVHEESLNTPEYTKIIREFQKRREITVIPCRNSIPPHPSDMKKIRPSVHKWDGLMDILLKLNLNGFGDCDIFPHIFPQENAIGHDNNMMITKFCNLRYKHYKCYSRVLTAKQFCQMPNTNWQDVYIRALPGLMVDGYLRHSGSTAMRWCVSNATISGKENYKVKYKGQSKNSLGLFIALLRAGVYNA